MDGPALAGPVASGSHMADKMAATRAACCDLSCLKKLCGHLGVWPCIPVRQLRKPQATLGDSLPESRSENPSLGEEGAGVLLGRIICHCQRQIAWQGASRGPQVPQHGKEFGDRSAEVAEHGRLCRDEQHQPARGCKQHHGSETVGTTGSLACQSFHLRTESLTSSLAEVPWLSLWISRWQFQSPRDCHEPR